MEFIFTDIDDTLTTNGKLPPQSYQALWDLFNKGYKVIPVTGRPAGWCEMIARLWPVDAVIGENGGFYFKLTNNEMKRVFFEDEATRIHHKNNITNIKNHIKNTIPHSKIASDQFSRLLDLAVDICEDIEPHLTKKEIQQVLDIFKHHGATAKVSSIHVNGWFGSYDKLTMCKHYLKNEFNIRFEDAQKKSIFVGDSPNDEPMFEAFDNSFGVANIKSYLSELSHPPDYITKNSGGEGFVEISNYLLS